MEQKLKMKIKSNGSMATERENRGQTKTENDLKEEIIL